MITDEDVKRINELYHKMKSEGLTDAEKDEQARLRKAYIEAMKANVRSQMNMINIQNEDGSVESLKERYEKTHHGNN